MTDALRAAACALVFTTFAASAALGAPTAAAPIEINLDATRAAQKFFRVKVTLPASPGPFTFVYPRWIPGYHGPVGPIEAVVDLHVLARGAALEWRRDLVDMYAIHTVVPPGASSVEVDFAVAGAPSHNGQSEVVSTAELAVLEFSNFVVYPQGATAEATQVRAQMTLPPGWTFGTALPVAARSAATVTFAPASLYTLVDSPIIAGAHEKAFPLGDGHVLDAAGDAQSAVDVSPRFLTGMKHLIAEGPALYGGKHYRDYHFLLTLSESVGSNGIEHHESSDNRAGEKYAQDDQQYRLESDLLPHEYSHSWNGKYRRPADLAVPDYQQPERTDLLWVYEGLNQYNGEKLATRARINTFGDQLDRLASTAASMEVESGRAWRPLRDTADGAPFLYTAPEHYYNIRRSAGDFYSEGDLIWLDADVTIRRLTHGAKSLDDFCKLWGNGTDTSAAPSVHAYDESDVYALMGRVVAYDWAAFFKQRIATVQPHAPLGGITAGGYRLTFNDHPSDLLKAQDAAAKQIDARFSLGATIASDGQEDGTIRDILTGSAAFAAGLAPGTRIIAVDGRRWSGDALHDALVAHKGDRTPLRLIVENGDSVRVVEVEAHDGERYPHLVRNPAIPDQLVKLYAPKTFAPPVEHDGSS